MKGAVEERRKGTRVMTEGSGERATGTSNTIYDLSSVLFHALEGGASYDQYIRDAEEAGDQELADFFIQVRDEDSNRANEAQQLIAERTPSTGRAEATATSVAEGSVAGVSPRPEPSDNLPGTEPIAEGAPSGDVRRETAVTRATEEDLAAPGEEGHPDIPRAAGIEGGALGRTEQVPPPRTEEVPSGSPPQAPSGDVQRDPSPEEPSPTIGEAPRVEEERAGLEKREEDKGLIDKARDYLRGEGRERDYLRGEDRER
jgi:hypothetical protein